MTYKGQCVGGPYDGQILVHWTQTLTLCRPMVAALVVNTERAPVEAVPIGEYRLNDSGQWHWKPAAHGMALRNFSV